MIYLYANFKLDISEFTASYVVAQQVWKQALGFMKLYWHANKAIGNKLKCVFNLKQDDNKLHAYLNSI